MQSEREGEMQRERERETKTQTCAGVRVCEGESEDAVYVQAEGD